jgi:hypothetical protein
MRTDEVNVVWYGMHWKEGVSLTSDLVVGVDRTT